MNCYYEIMLVKKDMVSGGHCHTTFVSCISMSSVCCLPLPPAQRHEFCGLDEPAEREGEPRAPAGAVRPLKNDKKLYTQRCQCQYWSQLWVAPLFWNGQTSKL